MTTHSFKHKILLDENFTARSLLPLFNERFDVKHISHDYHQDGMSDDQVYTFAVKNKRILVTFNVKDFVNFVSLSKETGIVGVSANMPTKIIDQKLRALFIKSSEHSLFGKVTYITGETEV